MAGKPEVQCRDCDMWIPMNPDLMFVPRHNVMRLGSEIKCSGGGVTPKAKRNFPKPGRNR